MRRSVNRKSGSTRFGAVGGAVVAWLLLGIDGSKAADVYISSELTLPDPPIELSPAVSVIAQTSPIDGSGFIGSRQTIGQFASTIEGDHEDAGILTNGGGPYGGVVATHVIYTNDEFNLQLPPGSTLSQTLFAPTTRPPNGACLELGTAYRTAPGEQTNATVYVFDFCGGKKFAKQTPVGEEFISKYTFKTADGHRAYNISITTNAPVPGISANWNAALYNFGTNRWDIIYSTTGVHTDRRGWTIFETWFQKGQCSKSLPPIFAWDINYKNLSTSTWELATPNMHQMTVNQHDGKSSDAANTNCFNDDKTGAASYIFSALKADSAWQVAATGH
jgi:hypothetical protein